jgi:hypothetical protein
VCNGQRGSGRENGGRIGALATQTHQTPRLRMGTSIPPLPLWAYMTYHSVIFNIDDDDDDDDDNNIVWVTW